MSQSAGVEASEQLTLNPALHIKYWLRCLKTFLPTRYQEQDSSRIVLGFFTLFSLDILGGIEQHTTEEQRTSFINFIYSCQHPDGGFRSFPGTDFGDDRRTNDNARWDPANIAGTYFALASLAILGDDLSQVSREATLSWVRNLQREDGSFGDIASGPHGIVDGGQDVRFCFLASLVCVILGSETSPLKNIEKHVNAETLVQFISQSQAYDGGIARKPHCESHAGSTYCGISTLNLLDRLPASNAVSSQSSKSERQLSPEFLDNLLYWLAHRQTTMLSDYQDMFQDEDSDEETDKSSSSNLKDHGEAGFAILNATPALPPHLLDFEALDSHAASEIVAGLNGRVNKPADTCYSFWAGATLSILGYPAFIDQEANRRYLLTKTQHRIGGFGKFPGDPPDILHSALALACLAIHGEPGLKPIDPIFCVSLDVKARLDNVAWRRGG